MINLLPDEAKKELELEKTGEKISILLFFVLLAFIGLIVILSCLGISLFSQKQTIKALAEEQEHRLLSAEFLDFKQRINKTNENLSNFEKFEQKQISVSNILKNISAFKNTALSKTIYFSNFSFRKIIQKEKNKPLKIFANISVNGVANTREDLFFFKKELEKITDIQELYFSPSSWVEPKNVNFSFSFKTLCE